MKTAIYHGTERLAALVLCLVCLPAWLVMAVGALLTGGRLDLVDHELAGQWLTSPAIITGKGNTRCLVLINVLLGQLAFVGPTDTACPGHRPGLVSPGLLRRRMGIDHAANEGDEPRFFADAGLRDRAGLVVRYAWACLLSAARDDGGRETSLFGVRIDALSMDEAVATILERCDRPERRDMQLVAFVNPDCLNKAVRDRDYHYLLNNADVVLPDGSGLRIAARLLDLPLADNVNGTDLFPVLCAAAARAGKSLFLYGGQPGVALDAAATMQAAYPELRIAGCLDGYSHRSTPYAVVNAINESGADIVLAGLGAPLQERWLHAHRAHLKAAVGIGVGGLFDYYSGRIARAPLWLREAGLEWVWRILQEPRAKWRRYVIGNPLFLASVLRERRVRRSLRNSSASEKLLSPSDWAESLSTASVHSGRAAGVTPRRWRRRLAIRHGLKRMLDITVAASALLALSPLLLGTAALIRLESPGPILFRQVRVGRRGRLFAMLKFRSMFVDAEERLKQLQAQNESAGGVLFKMKKDPRVTRVGRFIRRFSIDELPQIINVLRGEMSIVGPRPALPSEVAQYTAADRKRLQTNPGLTCLWQIGGRSDLSFAEQVELDIDYLKQQDVFTDIGIMVKTVPAVINGKGAY